MAFKAQIRLSSNGPRSIDRKGLKLKQGQTIYTSNPSEVRALIGDPQFSVSITEGKMPPALTKSEPPPPDEDVDDESDDESDGDDDGPVADKYLKKDLEGQTKAELLALAANEFGLTLDGAAKKADLVAEILKAQDDQSAEPSDDES